MTNWRDTPPTKAGRYYAKGRDSGEEFVAILTDDELWYDDRGGIVLLGERPAAAAKLVQFGPRIPSLDEFSELRAMLPALEQWGRWALDEGWFEQSELDRVLSQLKSILGVA